MINDTSIALSVNHEVNRCKNRLIKERLRTLIKAKGMSEADFYNSIKISRQYWYYLSWGICDCPTELKVRIAQALGIDSSVIWQEDKEDE